MKVAVIIPAFNEAQTINSVILEVRKGLSDYSQIFIVVIDDGSADNTAQVARAAGADMVLSHGQNLGLAQAFKSGLDSALAWGADIIVNTDADGQYNNNEIKKLIKPIISQAADLVVGNRRVRNLPDMPFGKKYGNLLGSRIIGCLIKRRGVDASSGFRAFSREAALRLNVYFGHTYTHQTLIEAAFKKMRIATVPIEFRKRRDGDSRLIKGTISHIRTSLFIIVRTLLVYKPFKTFAFLGSFCFLVGGVLGLRFFYYYFFVSGLGKVQSLIFSAIFLISGVVFLVMGFLGDLSALNRRQGEDILYELKKKKYEKKD